MADNQKYYYMRLKESFFEEDAIKIIEGMPDGYLYSNILLKLYLKSLKYNGKLMFNNRIPYNPTVLATITGHQVGTVEKALDLFETLDLIEVLDNGAIYMLDIQNLIGKSSTEAERKRAYRAKIEAEKAALSSDGQMSGQCLPEIEIDIDIEKEKEIEIETESEKEKDSVPESDPPKTAGKRKNAPKYVEHPKLNAAIIAFVDYRKKIKKPMTEKAVELMIKKLNDLSPYIEDQIEILNQSILNGWQGIFPLKKESYSSSRSANIQNRVSNIDNW